MQRQSFILSGSGGQGVITMGILLAEAAALAGGRHAVQSQSYGPEARGGATRCDVIVSDEAIHYPKVREADVLVCLTQEAHDRYRPLLRPEGLLLTDASLVRSPDGEGVLHAALGMHQAVMDRLGKAQALNICVLGALVGKSGVIRPEFLETTLAKRFGDAHMQTNAAALKLGLDLAASRQ